MTTRLQVITDAARQIGKGEHPPGSNCQEFGAAYGFNCVAWCCISCSVILTRNGIPFHQASVGFAVEQARKQGRWAAHPRGPGDLIVLDWNGDGWGDHIGFVERNLVAPYQTIEFNTSDMVARRTRSSNILGFILIPYSDTPHTTPTPPPSHPATRPYPGHFIQAGASGPDVVWVQQQLIRHGFSVGNAGADGAFGPNTRNGVVAFQQANGLQADSIVGPQTWAALAR